MKIRMKYQKKVS